MESKFTGIYPVIPTPLKEDFSPDPDGISHLIDYYVEQGVHGLVILGSGGEFAYLSSEEKQMIISQAVKGNEGRLPIIAGTGYTGTYETIALSKYAKNVGVDAILVTLPTYHPIKFSQVYEHFKAVADNVDIPIIYYHYPECTHLKLTPKEIAMICEIDGIVGIKESVLNLREVKAHIKFIQKRPFSFFSGTSYLFLSILEIGGCGVICPVPTIIPKDLTSLYSAFLNGDIKQAREIEKRVFQTLPLTVDIPINPKITRTFMKILCKTGIPLSGVGRPLQAVFKEALHQMGHPISPIVKAPLPQITEKEKEKARKVLEKLRLLK